ncbi:MAG: hypothetical protein CM1200mP30_11070 [Pseudomonadota bacterium]|nr:MAG: hypothetical protein CM1200mP30_11070 [Pseudomonadota bacterium]
MNTKKKKFPPELTSAGIEASYPVTVFDEFGKQGNSYNRRKTTQNLY